MLFTKIRFTLKKCRKYFHFNLFQNIVIIGLVIRG